jgi:hypothetical protein
MKDETGHPINASKARRNYPHQVHPQWLLDLDDFRDGKIVDMNAD